LSLKGRRVSVVKQAGELVQLIDLLVEVDVLLYRAAPGHGLVPGQPWRTCTVYAARYLVDETYRRRA
jgi:hypothetical protein